jgi:glycosyltransferase involved in cell wall biosynthesis
VRYLLIFVIFGFLRIAAVENQTVCLNMIVKDESAVIKRCLESVKPLIDYWVIVDTGSSDNTKEIIRETMKGIPGELYERPWHNFEFNRNEALQFAKGKGDYVLFIDADEVLEYEKNFHFSNLNQDFYLFSIKNESEGRVFSEYHRVLLINNQLNWQWKGVMHEDIFCTDAKTSKLMEGVYNISRTYEGARAKDPNKYLKDALTLEKALEKEPNNSRYVYYLAASYYNAGKLDKALVNFQKRIDMQPNQQRSNEICTSLYFIGCIHVAQKAQQEVIMSSFSSAYLYDTSHAESLYQLAAYLIDQGQLFLAELVLTKALSIPEPKNGGYVLTWIYDWGLLHKYAECSFKLGKFREAKCALETLVTKPLPPDLLIAMKSNLALCQE